MLPLPPLNFASNSSATSGVDQRGALFSNGDGQWTINMGNPAPAASLSVAGQTLSVSPLMIVAALGVLWFVMRRH